MLKKTLLVSLLCISTTTVAFAVNTTSSDSTVSPNYNAIKWYRASAERNAIYREIFLMAQNSIKQQVAEQNLKPKQWGVVLDIDETALDNTVWDYQHDIQGNKASWQDFAKQARSIATPGVKTLIDTVHQMGGYVNLVSNRPIALQAVTEKNLKKQGIYFDQVLLDASNQGNSLVDKNPRFTAIVNGTKPSKLPAQKILAWFGDNIQDFPGFYQKQMIKQNSNSRAYQDFGVKYFVVPNPIYGSWEANTFG